MSVSMGTVEGITRYVIADPWNLDLWTIAVNDTQFYRWQNKEKNHIWDKVPMREVPNSVLAKLVEYIKGENV